MLQEPTEQDKRGRPVRKHPIIRKAVIAGVAAVVLMVILGLGTLTYNNVSLASDEAFARRLDAAIEKGLAWTQVHKETILKRRNVALIKMLTEIESLRATPVFSDIISSFMAAPSQPRCWKRLVDPNWPVDEIELNIAIKKEHIDNKWVLYAMAPDKAKITPEEMDLFNPERWQGRKLTHQLDALLVLRKTKGANRELDDLIEHLCNRLSSELIFDVAVMDIYIQKVTFVLRAGFPEKIRRRWIERIIANQLDDGGWNDRWFWFTSDSRRPVFGFARPPSTQHATVQALTALYLVKYRYPECFGLK
jgi:hypothetical protein